MSVGEKIQFYRKKHNMSQEELGQKLLVSRQTISLWETGQTMPTIDNLIRLREVFGVPVDEILSEKQEEQPEAQLPSESYMFSFTAEETELMKKYVMSDIKKFVLQILLLLSVTVFFAVSDVGDVLIGVLIGSWVALISIVIKSYLSHQKMWKKSQPGILKTQYAYDFYSDYFIVNIISDNDIKKMYKIRYSEIENPCDTGVFFFFQVNGQLFCIKKSDLSENSVLCGLFAKRAKKQYSEPKEKKINIISWALVWGSAFSVFAAAHLFSALSDFNGRFTDNAWVFFLFLPITIGSVIFGFKTQSENHKTTKNKIVGIIMTIILLIYGMFCVIFSDTYNYDTSVIEKVENYVGIDIPEPAKIMTQDWTSNSDGETVNGMYYTTDVSFSEKVADDFEKQLASSNEWNSELSTEFRGLFPGIYSSVSADYYLLYNIDSDELNTLPSDTGMYRFLLVIYTVESNSMDIVEYDIEYIK